MALALPAALTLFVALAALVAAGATATLDRAILVAFGGLHGDALTVVMQGLSLLGSGLAVTASGALASAWLLWRGHRRAALRVAGALVLAALLTIVLKLAFDRPRPDVFVWLDEPHGASFPSGHSLSGALHLPLLAWTAHEVHAAPRWLVPASLAVGAAIAASRCYLGVHWPSDVVAGFALGLALLALALRYRVTPAALGNLAATRR